MILRSPLGLIGMAHVSLLGLILWSSPVEAKSSEESPKLLSWTEQIAVREAWLPKRYEMLLTMMRRHEIDMWIVVNEEFHDDPLTEYVAPPRPYAGNRDTFVFVDAGEEGLRKIVLAGYEEEHLTRFFELP